MPVGVACDCEICTPGSRSTAPATKSALQVHQVLRLPRNLYSATRGPAAPTRSRRLCVLRLPQNLRSSAHQVLRLPQNLHFRLEICTQPRGPAAPTQSRRLCTAPAAKSGTPGSPSTAPATKSTRHCRFTKCCACHEICTQPHTAQRCPRTPQLIREALCTAPATKSALQAHQVLCLPRNLHCRFTKRCA